MQAYFLIFPKKVLMDKELSTKHQGSPHPSPEGFPLLAACYASIISYLSEIAREKSRDFQK